MLARGSPVSSQIMNEPRRFEIVLPAELRGRLFALAAEIGTGAADLARLAILRLVNERAALTADRRERFAIEQPQISQWEGPQTGTDSGDEVLAEVRNRSELYRALRERSQALNLSRKGLDTLAGLETGYSAKYWRRTRRGALARCRYRRSLAHSAANCCWSLTTARWPPCSRGSTAFSESAASGFQI